MRYFFDYWNNHDVSADEEGAEFPSLEAVQAEALRLLQELVELIKPINTAQRISIVVRDEAGQQVVQAPLEKPTKH
jgi:hypothetical protein